MPKTSKILFGLILAVLVFNCCGAELVEAADAGSFYSNENILGSTFGLSSVDSDLQRIFRGITGLAKSIVTIMTALAGMMVCLNIGGDHKQKIWNWILGIGLALNFGSVLWYFWHDAANMSAGQTAAAEYSFKILNATEMTGDGSIDTLSTFMKIYLTFIVAGSLKIAPIAVKLLLGLALADMSIRLALDLTEKDKVSWLVKTFLRIGFYIWLITHWLGVDGLNLMDTLSKAFQQIGFMAGNYGDATLVTATQAGIDGINPKDNLAPDSIVTNSIKMFQLVFGFGTAPPPDPNAPAYQQIGETIGNAVTGLRRGFVLISSPISFIILGLCLVIFIVIAFLAAVEMFMARIEFYTLALLAIPLLAFGVVKHFEYLAQNAIRAVFNCGVKVCCISFLQAVICQMFTKYTNEVKEALDRAAAGNGTFTELLSISLQMLLMSCIMYLIISKVPKLIQGLLSGNPSMGGSDMTGAVMGTVGTAASTAATAVGTVAGAKAAATKAAADGKTGWRMSTMGQLGAAMLAKAPITGTAYGAYNALTRATYNEPDRDPSNSSQKPTPSEPKPKPQKAKGRGHRVTGGGTDGGGGTGGNTQPRGGNQINQQTSAPPPVSASSAQYSPTQQNTRLASSSDSSGSTWKGSPNSSGSNSSANNTSPTNNQATSVTGSSSKSVPAATSAPISKSTNTQNTSGVWRRRSGNSVPPKEPPKV